MAFSVGYEFQLFSLLLQVCMQGGSSLVTETSLVTEMSPISAF